VFFALALRRLKATIIFVEHKENVGKKRAAKMPHPNEIFGISISLLPLLPLPPCCICCGFLFLLLSLIA
jgi:hypothetical protein